jgi:DNA-binding MarR family transcriptional regulator
MAAIRDSPRHGSTPAHLPTSLTTSAGFLLSKVAQAAGELMLETLGQLGVKPRHVGVLAVLAENGPLSQHAVGELLRIDRTTMVALVDELEQWGLARRQPDPRDRRAYRLELTPAGRHTLGQAEAAAAQANAALLAPLGPAEQRQLLELLQRLSDVCSG